MILSKDIDKNEWFDNKLLEKLGSEYVRVGTYTNTKTDVEIRHLPCNRIFNSKPYNLLQGYGCAKCSSKLKRTTDTFKEDLYSKYGNEYEVLGEYINVHTKVKIKHMVCNHIYEVKPNNILNNNRKCPLCSGCIKKDELYVQNFLDEKFPEEFRVIGKYKNKDTPIEVIHRSCNNVITPTFNNIRSSKFGCMFCTMSSGELQISKILSECNINYTYQYKNSKCKDKKILPFDFYFEINNIPHIIEYDGRQHFLPIFGNDEDSRGETLRITKHHDAIKNNFCKDNNIKLLRVSYIETEIKNIIKDFINK